MRFALSPPLLTRLTGSKKLFVSYYRKRVYADLLPDGSIQFKDTIYQSPVPCALQMKRSLNPCTPLSSISPACRSYLLPLHVELTHCALGALGVESAALKTDAGWSSMFSAASGESLKDIKDRLNIRKRGPNIRTTMKKAPSASVLASASLAAKERLVNAAVEITRLAPVAPVRKCELPLARCTDHHSFTSRALPFSCLTARRSAPSAEKTQVATSLRAARALGRRTSSARSPRSPLCVMRLHRLALVS